MSNYTFVLGIDVSQATLDIATLSEQVDHFKQISNTDACIKTWIKSLPTKNVLCVIEATGCYSNRIVHYLGVEGIAISLVNPNQSHGFTQALGIISKDDRQAAYTLALMGQRLDLLLHQPKSVQMQQRKQLLMGINALRKQRQMLKNQLHALDNQIVFAPKVVQALRQTLQTVEEQLQQLEEQLDDLSDEEHLRQFELLTSVVGIGPRTAHLLLDATGGIHHFKHARQLSKFTGLAPCSHTSGRSVRKKGRISKKGNGELRACLYMAARSAKKYNLACKDLYDRLRQVGKPHKQAMVAVMNKLVKQAFGVVNSGVSFDNEYYLAAIRN